MTTLLEAVSPTARKLLKQNKQRVHDPRALFDEVTLTLNESFARHFRSFGVHRNDDERLIRLWKLANEVGDSALLVSHASAEFREMNRHNLQFCLKEFAGYVCVWLNSMAESPEEVLDCIWKERLRQMSLRAQKPDKYPFALEHPLPDVRRKFRVLAEEVGEVADALDKLESASRHQRTHAEYHLECELIQTGAVAMAWLESFETTNNRGES